MKKMLKFKKVEGITLIALVITIIVLLILAGVSIATLSGENGILSKAANAKIEQDHATVLETMQLEIQGNMINNHTKKDEEEKDTMTFLQSEGYIDANGVVNTSKIKLESSTGQGTNSTGDIYKVEQKQGKIVLVYYNLELEVTELGVLIEEEGGLPADFWTANGVNEEYLQSTGKVLGGRYNMEMDTFTCEYTNLKIPEAVGLNRIQYLSNVTEVSGYVKGASFNTWPNLKKADIYLINDNEYGTLNEMFYNCINLESVKLDNITAVENYTFYNCKKLTKVQLPETVTRIWGYAFNNCESLESIAIPNGVTNVGKDIFKGCTNLKTIYSDSSEVKRIASSFSGVGTIEIKPYAEAPAY